MAQNFLTIEETAKKWRVSTTRLQRACEEGAVEGAAQLNGQWIIPENAVRPRIKQEVREKRPRVQYKDGMERTITARTPVQEAAIDAISKGENLGSVQEYKIGNTTFVVTSVFKRQGQTASEAFWSYVRRQLQQDGTLSQFPNKEERAEWDAFMKELRSKDPVFTTTREEKMAYRRRQLAEYGFTPEEIEILMAKVEADYEEPIF